MINILTVEKNLALYPTAIDQVIHPVEAAQQGGLTAATGPDKRRDAFFGYVQINAVQCPICAVKQLQVPEAEIGRASCRERGEIKGGEVWGQEKRARGSW